MDNLAFLILFIFPGIFIRMVYDRFFPSINEEKSNYKEVAHSFLISTVILFANAIIIRICYGINIISLDEFKKFIAIYNNFIAFFFLTLTLIIIGVPIYRWIMDYAAIKLINIFRKKKRLSFESKHLSPWHAVFENKEFNLTDRPIGIFKGEKLVTLGILSGYSAADKKNKEFLVESTWIKDLYYADKNKETKDKLFDRIDVEYYNPEIDMLIKFYDNQYLMKYLRENGHITSLVE